MQITYSFDMHELVWLPSSLPACFFSVNKSSVHRAIIPDSVVSEDAVEHLIDSGPVAVGDSPGQFKFVNDVNMLVFNYFGKLFDVGA